MSRYISLQDLRDYLSPTGALGTTQDGLLQDCINRAESAIDTYTRRSFGTVQETKYYNRFTQTQVAESALYLDKDLYALGTLVNGDGQTIPVGSIWLEPRNVGPPYRILRLKSSYVWVWNTDSDVQITGAWGFSPTAPEDIQQATVRLSAYYYRQKDTGPGEVAGFADGGEVQIPKGMPDDVRYALAPYRSRSGGVV